MTIYVEQKRIASLFNIRFTVKHFMIPNLFYRKCTSRFVHTIIIAELLFAIEYHLSGPSALCKLLVFLKEQAFSYFYLCNIGYLLPIIMNSKVV